MAAVRSVRAAVARDLKALPGDHARSALAATALALAREIDDPGNPATAKSMCARALTETLDKLRALAPQEEREDGVDEIASRRAARLGGAAS